ncbi:hypothetical protein KKC52_03620 [bacterium]|nr:hypothetical protein [bacterium]
MAQIFKSYTIEKHGISLWFNWTEEEGQWNPLAYAALLAGKAHEKDSFLKQKVAEKKSV